MQINNWNAQNSDNPIKKIYKITVNLAENKSNSNCNKFQKQKNCAKN